MEKGLTKASRSGAFSKASTGYAIRPNGGKWASEFVDKCSPKGWKPPQQRAVPKEQTRKVDVPPAACTITHLCIDCLGPVDESDAPSIIPSMFIITGDNIAMNFAMGVEQANIVLCVEHVACAKKAQTEQKDRTPLILVRNGNVASAEDIRIAEKYGLPLYPHDGQELTIGQFALHKRRDRLQENLQDVMINLDKKSECYRRNRKEITKC
jgi:hypothetical protein